MSSSSHHKAGTPTTTNDNNDKDATTSLTTNDANSASPSWNVDICAAVISNKPPLLPLREELPSLGFEVILGAAGVGAKTAKQESKQAVEAYRRSLQYHDLQKRRLFPKCKRRIQEKIQARKQKEQDIALPHACSYESYEMRMLRARGRSMSRPDLESSSANDTDDSFATMLSDRVRNRQQVKSNFPDLLFLAPDRHHRDDVSSSKDSSSRRRLAMDNVPDVFGAFDNLDDDITSGRSGSIATAVHVRQQQEDAPGCNSVQHGKEREDEVEAARISQSQEHQSEQQQSERPQSEQPQSEQPQSEQPQSEQPQSEQPQSEQPATKPVDQTTSQCRQPTAAPMDRATATAFLSMPTLETNTSKVLQSPNAADVASTNPFDSTLSSSMCHVTNAGGEATVKSSESNALAQMQSNGLKAADWMSTAKNAFENFSSEVLKATSCKTDSIQNRVEDPVTRLFASLKATPDIATLQSVLTEVPALALVRREQDGRMPLHVLADQTLPFRNGNELASSLTETLLKDINQMEQAVHLLVDAQQGACAEFDKQLDLPVHLMARRLMEWEATWYESIYHSAAQDGDGAGAIEVSELYHAMSRTVERLLQPLTLTDKKHLCQAPGGMGTILPLHVAAIFTVSVHTTRLLLEAYPGAARITCDLGILRTFVPDECLAIELHDNLSTDFPKWELDQDDEALIIQNDEDRIRRSDLLFAYNPIEPHRFEKARISRFELQIQYDATIIGTKPEHKLDSANERVWLWMCSFVEPESGRATYANSVKRIVSGVNGASFHHLRDLVMSAERGPNEQHINDECRACLSSRNDEIGDRNSKDGHSSQGSSNTVDELCRLVFHIPAVSFPTSFVVLPYKLRRAPDGSMSLENPEECSAIASSFAKSLIELTEPSVLQDMLKVKWERFNQTSRHLTPQAYGNSVMRLNQKKTEFLGLYSTVGYFYVLDRFTGLPDLEAFGEDSYPLELTNPAVTVDHLFPLMLMGMLQMRGNKAIPKLVQICLDKDLPAISPSWFDAVQRLQLWLAAQPHSNTIDSMAARINDLLLVESKRSFFPTTEKFEEWSSEVNALHALINTLSPTQVNVSGSEFKPLESPISSKLKTVSFVDDDVIPKEHSKRRDPPVVDVIDLTMKMDTLCEYQGLPLNANGGPALQEEYPSSPELVFSDEDERDILHYPEITDVTGLSDEQGFSSRYSPLFNMFTAEKSSENITESRDEINQGVQVWNEIDRVWEEVEWQLRKRTETMCEDSQILQLKVDLAEQAKMLANLGKKVSYLREKERRFSKRDVEVVDLTGMQQESSSLTEVSKADPRSLFIRLGDLEDRLVCDEIRVQHFSMESHTVEHEGDSMLTSLEPSSDSAVRKRPIPLPAPIDIESSPQMLRQTSDATISFSGDESSFRPYGTSQSAPNSKTSDQMVEIDSRSSSYSNIVPRVGSTLQPSVSVDLDAVSPRVGADSTDSSQSPPREPSGEKVRQRSSTESPRSVNERLLITRPLGLRESSGSSSKDPVSSIALTQETIADSNYWERREGKSDSGNTGSDGWKDPINDERARRNLLLLKKLSQESRSDSDGPSGLLYGPRTQKLATRLRSFQEEKESFDPTVASNASSIFRLETINVPKQPFPPRDYSGLTHSYSLNSHSELATEIDNLILRYAASDDSRNYSSKRRQLI